MALFRRVVALFFWSPMRIGRREWTVWKRGTASGTASTQEAGSGNVAANEAEAGEARRNEPGEDEWEAYAQWSLEGWYDHHVGRV